jgi:thioesterase domain-containing protein
VALKLGADYPSYGVNARAFAVGGPDLSIELLASQYVGEIRAFLGHGQPFVLVGYSMGATIAYEMARQLALADDAARLLVIIAMPASNLRCSRMRKALEVMLNLPAWVAGSAMRSSPKSLLIRARGHAEEIISNLRGRRQPEFNARIYFGMSDLPARYQSFLKTMHAALLNYVPGQYPGKLVLLRPEVPTLFRTRKPAMGWESLASGGVEVLPVPGNHTTCVEEPRSLRLAAVLKRRLDSLDSE